MVTSIVPGAAGANAFAVENRFARPNGQSAQTREGAAGDRVELSGASLSLSRQSVERGLAELQETLALGRDAQALLVKAQELAQSGGSQADLDALLQAYQQRIDAANAQGMKLANGDAISVQAEPGAAGVTIAGADLRLGGGIVGIEEGAQVSDPDLAPTAQRSLEALQDAMTRLSESARALEAHKGFLGAMEKVSGVRTDLDADGARLMALQVRQGLEQSGGLAIANAEPQAVLSLFRA
ncbi:MAG: hypothetical protein JNJ63_07465 [Hyphomonadaceae bacterium]|nr:hypothetical protein [Hyphomonadaceae bacterium]